MITEIINKLIAGQDVRIDSVDSMIIIRSNDITVIREIVSKIPRMLVNSGVCGGMNDYYVRIHA